MFNNIFLISYLTLQDDPTGISPSSGEKKPKARVKKEKPEKAEKPDKVDKAEKTDGLKQTKLTFKKEPKKVNCLQTLLFIIYALHCYSLIK